MFPSGEPLDKALREVSLADADRVLTVKEICYVLKKSRWTVWRWKKRGCPIVHGRILWSALLLWLEQDENGDGENTGKRIPESG